jgi:hypothetical protein
MLFVFFTVGQSKIFLHESIPFDDRKPRKFSMKRFSIPLKRKKRNKKSAEKQDFFFAENKIAYAPLSPHKFEYYKF